MAATGTRPWWDGTAAELGGDSTRPSPGDVAGPRLRAFPGQRRELAALREWLTSLLPDCPARDDLLLVANELAANAVAHTASGQGGWFTAQITVLGPVVRVAVSDEGGAGAPAVISDPDGETGRGLLLVTSLSERTGVTGDHRGRLVWADLPWDQPGDSLPAAPRAGTGQTKATLPAGQPHG